VAGLSRAGLSPGCRTPDSAAASARAEAQAPKRSLTSEFDYRTAHDEGLTEWGEVCEETIWENIGYFLQAIIPVAEQAGVQMALHPDAPPISPLRGIARILTSSANIRRVLDLVPSQASGLTFCQASFKAMGEDIEALAREWS